MNGGVAEGDTTRDGRINSAGYGQEGGVTAMCRCVDFVGFFNRINVAQKPEEAIEGFHPVTGGLHRTPKSALERPERKEELSLCHQRRNAGTRRAVAQSQMDRITAAHIVPERKSGRMWCVIAVTQPAREM
jgi:hypothetical protein